jgi:hypothetical protein
MSPIMRLVCGDIGRIAPDERDEAIEVLVGLSHLIGSYYTFALDFKKSASLPQSSFFLPVALRSLMEASAIALLTKVDPLRVIHANKCQDSENYLKSRQQASALKWKGDVMADEVPSADGKKSIWDPNMSTQKLPRALLSEHSCQALWIPATKASIKWLTSRMVSDSQWIRDLLNIQPEDFQKVTVGTGNRLYSELSKGIHPEFAVRREIEFDEATLKTVSENSMKWVSTLAFVSNFATGFGPQSNFDDALADLLSIEADMK